MQYLVRRLRYHGRLTRMQRMVARKRSGIGDCISLVNDRNQDSVLIFFVPLFTGRKNAPRLMFLPPLRPGILGDFGIVTKTGRGLSPGVTSFCLYITLVTLVLKMWLLR